MFKKIITANITLLLSTTFLFSGCFNRDEWLGIVYPDKNNLLDHRVVGQYETLNACLAVVNKSVGTKGSYECAKNCDKSAMPMVCEETVGNEK